MSNYNQIFSEIFAHREAVEKLSENLSEIFAHREAAEKLSENLSEQEQHESEERLNKIGKKSPRSSASVD